MSFRRRAGSPMHAHFGPRTAESFMTEVSRLTTQGPLPSQDSQADSSGEIDRAPAFYGPRLVRRQLELRGSRTLNSSGRPKNPLGPAILLLRCLLRGSGLRHCSAGYR